MAGKRRATTIDPSDAWGKVREAHRLLGEAIGMLPPLPVALTDERIRGGLSRPLSPLGPPVLGPVAEEEAVRAAVQQAAAREPPGSLLSMRQVRALAPLLPKEPFDQAVMRLSRAGELSLHHHDFPESLPEPERALLVKDERGTHYIGLAPRRR
jgi:hypothetical protein